MSALRFGYVTGPVLGALWLFVLATTLAVLMSFATGDPIRPAGLWSLFWGAALGLGLVALRPGQGIAPLAAGVAFVLLAVIGIGPVASGESASTLWKLVGSGALGLATGWSLLVILGHLPGMGALTRHEFEEAVIRFLTGFGYIFFTAIVAIPFYVMVMTSLKNQSTSPTSFGSRPNALSPR